MMIKPAGQILTEEIDSAVAELKSCVTPIFDVNDKGEAWGRPVGVALDKHGALLVADDVGNAIWRVTTAK